MSWMVSVERVVVMGMTLSEEEIFNDNGITIRDINLFIYPDLSVKNDEWNGNSWGI